GCPPPRGAAGTSRGCACAGAPARGIPPRGGTVRTRRSRRRRAGGALQRRCSCPPYSPCSRVLVVERWVPADRERSLNSRQECEREEREAVREAEEKGDVEAARRE